MTSPTERVFHEENMYSLVKEYAEARGYAQTLWALDFAGKMHAGQTRKGPEAVPYISHPLYMACQAICLDLAEDNLLAAVLLHDVCEDCGVNPDQLEVGCEVKEAVRLVTRQGSCRSCILPGYFPEPSGIHGEAAGPLSQCGVSGTGNERGETSALCERNGSIFLSASGIHCTALD